MVEITMKVRPATLEMLRQCVRDKIQAFFDDPYGVCESDCEITTHHQALIDACHDLNLDFWIIVREETTENERRRMYSVTGVLE